MRDLRVFWRRPRSGRELHGGMFPAVVLASLVGCGEHRAPPPHTAIGGLPVSGSLADARYAGFTHCVEDTVTMRCRRGGVVLAGQGPYSAAVDLDGGDGAGGFDQLTLWHDRDQNAVLAIGKVLKQRGWRSCMTGEGARGDQEIFTRPGARAWLSMDISYWGKRRMRVIPSWNARGQAC